jgi:hypothetical protein
VVGLLAGTAGFVGQTSETHASTEAGLKVPNIAYEMLDPLTLP